MKIITRSPNPFFYLGDETGILLIHGFTGSPSEMRPMGNFLREQGYTVYAPLLAGHGTSPEDLAKTTWQDWLKSVESAYDRLQTVNMKHIYIVGHSMGGLLAFQIASKLAVDGVISLCAPIWLRDWRAKFVGVLRFLLPYRRRTSKKKAHIESQLVPYDRTPLKSIGQLNQLIRKVKREISHIDVPTLVIQSRKDETVLPKSANFIYDRIATDQKELSWYENSSHMITVDKERKRLFQEIDNFISTKDE